MEGTRRRLKEVDTSAGIRLLGAGVATLTEFAQDDLFTTLAPAPAVEEVDAAPVPVQVEEPATTWRPGQDVRHDAHGAGWVWGSGLGRITVRFEGPATGPGPVRTFATDDPALHPAGPPDWTPVAARPLTPGGGPGGS